MRVFGYSVSVLLDASSVGLRGVVEALGHGPARTDG